jgi:hypothetical protein
MSEEIENKINKIPIVKQLVFIAKAIKLKSLEGMSLYDILEMYVLGIFRGAFSYRASAIAFSFFMALFPFALFILNLIPFIPLENFQDDFLKFVEDVIEVATVGIPQCYLSVKKEEKEGLIKNLKDVQADALKRIIGDLFQTKSKTESAGLSFDELNKKFEKNDRLLTSGYVREYSWRILKDGKANDLDKKEKEREMSNTN